MSALRRNLLFARAALTRRVPIYVQFAVTTRCNMVCSMCRANESREGERELGVAEIAILADHLERLGVGILVLTGGEPLLRVDLPEIVRLFSERGLSVRLQSNALLADPETVRALVEAGLEDVTVSLHSLDPEINDRITGVPGSWERILAGLATFGQALPGRGALGGVNITVNRHNLADLPDLVRFVTDIGLYASLIPVHLDEGRGDGDYIVRAHAPEMGIDPSHHDTIDRVYAKLMDMKRSGFHLYNTYRFLRESRDYLKTGEIRWRCLSPDMYFSISPQGHFLPCVDLPGDESMLDPGFVERYRSREFREHYRRQASTCAGCMYACYPELTYIARHPLTFLERVAFARAVEGRRRARLSAEQMVARAEALRPGRTPR